ncbi:MAG: hypothetical protein M0006_11390 [Magnetospirillum sp.]|nr:hypothetical protein [Magnetospirillum sp.]
MLRAIAATVLAVWAGQVWAGESAIDLLDAPVTYSAHFYVASDKGTYRGSVWHSPGRERRDFATAGGGQAVLLMRDQDAAYLLKPSGKWYVGVGLHAAAALAGGIDGMTVDRKKVGDETVAGLRATRFHVQAASARGGRFDGDAWFSRDGILVKAAGVLVGPDGRPERVETGLTDVVVGKVDPHMLTLPAGYFGMDLRQVPADKIEQAVANLMPLLAGGAAHQ